MKVLVSVVVLITLLVGSCQAFHSETHCGSSRSPSWTSPFLEKAARDTIPCTYTSIPCYNYTIRDQYLGGLYQSSSSHPVRVVLHIPRRSDGTRPLAGHNQMAAQFEALRTSWAPVNVHPDPIIHYVDNDSLWAAVVDTSSPTECGNGHCGESYPYAGWDCGDCYYRTQYKDVCLAASVGNGECNVECNVPWHDWDGGDCCLSSAPIGSCIDPASAKSVVMTEDDWKASMVGSISGTQALHFFVVPRFFVYGLLGIATFPWDAVSQTSSGGLMVAAYFKGVASDATLIPHEAGHCLGLWHTFTGVSEEYCNECSENIDTPDRNVVGDFCADTQPLPLYYDCAHPPTDYDCDANRFTDYPDLNIMSYTSCQLDTTFTDQQNGIIGCFLDTTVRSWQGSWNGGSFQTPPTAPNTWTCDASHYGTHDGCHCGCGAADPDCSDTRPSGTTAVVFGCADNADSTSCDATGACVYRVTNVPAAWTCPAEWYSNSDGCDCNCGAVDPDCSVDQTTLYGCPLGLAGTGTASCSAQAKCVFSEVTASPYWLCPASTYNANDGCDCNCGIYDPDCARTSNLEVFNCPSGYTCSDNGNCIQPEPDANWQCDPSYYGAFDGCDCGCGSVDPDCEDAVEGFKVWGCSSEKFQYCTTDTNNECLLISSFAAQLRLRSSDIGCNIAGLTKAHIATLCVISRNDGYGLYTCEDQEPNYYLAAIGTLDGWHFEAIDSENNHVGKCQVELSFSSGFVIGAQLECDLTYADSTCTFHYSPAFALLPTALPVLLLAVLAAVFF